MTHHAPEFRHPDDMEWQMGRFGNVTKFLFHPTPDRPTVPNAGFLRYEPGAGFPLHRHDFAQVWYIIDGEFQMGERRYGRLHGRPALRERDAHRDRRDRAVRAVSRSHHRRAAEL